MRFLMVASIASATFLTAASLSAQELSIEGALGLCMKVNQDDERLECFEALARAAAPKQSAKIEKQRAKDSKTASAADVKNTETQKQSTKLEVKTKKKRGGIFPFNRFKKSSQKYVFVKPNKDAPQKARVPKAVKRVAYDARVLKAWRNVVDDLYVALDNGEVWKHADPGRPRLPKPGAGIRIKPGRAGSWLMTFANKSPGIRVRLIRSGD